MTHPKITENTEKSYLKVVNTALNYSKSRRKLDWENPGAITMSDVARDLADRKDIVQSTKITARAALLWYFKTQHDASSTSDGVQALDILRDIDQKRGRPVSSRPKKISQADLNLLLQEISHRSRKSVWAARCAVWIQAGLACGARPIEWLNAEWVHSDRTILKITNAKVHIGEPAFMRDKNNKKNDDKDSDEIDEKYQSPDRVHRLIPVQSTSDQNAIDNHLSMIEEFLPRSLPQDVRSDMFHQYHQNCRLILDRVSRKIWSGKKQYSFYTMRKQFSANMKASLGSSVTAGLMGHSGVNSLSTSFYGKANQAHDAFKGKESAAESWRPAATLKESEPTVEKDT